MDTLLMVLRGIAGIGKYTLCVIPCSTITIGKGTLGWCTLAGIEKATLCAMPYISITSRRRKGCSTLYVMRGKSGIGKGTLCVTRLKAGIGRIDACSTYIMVCLYL